MVDSLTKQWSVHIWKCTTYRNTGYFGGH